MKKIAHIARNELYALFYSPIAWVLMIVFVVMTSADYIQILDLYVGYFQQGGGILRQMGTHFTNLVLSDPRGSYLPKVISNLYIFFPLITMGLISRETGSGTIKLLYSSPVRIRDIILGKFLAILSFTACLLLLVILTLVGVSFSVAHPDYGQMMSAILGLFLVLATYAAIGLFISSLTNYQIVAALITLALFSFLSFIGTIGQEYSLVRNITYYLDIGSKAYNFLNGLVSVRDFAYFLIIISSFLLFTIIRISSARESVSVFRKARRYALVIVIAFAAAWITGTSQVNKYADATRDDNMTIAPHTQEMLAKLDEGELKITAFCSLFFYNVFRMLPDKQNTIRTQLWERYTRFKPDIKLDYVYYYDGDSMSMYNEYVQYPNKSMKEIAERRITGFNMEAISFLPPEEVNKLYHVGSEEYRNFFVLEYKGRKAVLRVFDDNEYWPSEDEIVPALNRLITTPPKILFLTDELERSSLTRSSKSYHLLSRWFGKRKALANQGYDVDTLSLRNHDIPGDIAGLVIADPRTQFTPGNLEKINRYIDKGGNIFITSEADRADVIKPVFDKLGLAFRPGQLLQPGNSFGNECVFSILTDSAQHYSPRMKREMEWEIKYSADSLLRVPMNGVGALDYQAKDGFHVDALLRTIPAITWNRVAPISKDSLNLPIPPLPNDEHGSFITALRMTRMVNGRQQRIVVCGDADFLNEMEIEGDQPRRHNFSFAVWSIGSFSYGQFPGWDAWPEGLDQAFTIKVDNIPFQKLIYYWIIPAIIAIVASILLIRRKRK